MVLAEEFLHMENRYNWSGSKTAGRLDLCVNLLDQAWDCAAAACIVTEAGGTYSDVRGEKTVHSGSFVLTNGWLHEPILDALAADAG